MSYSNNKVAVLIVIIVVLIVVVVVVVKFSLLSKVSMLTEYYSIIVLHRCFINIWANNREHYYYYYYYYYYYLLLSILFGIIIESLCIYRPL